MQLRRRSLIECQVKKGNKPYTDDLTQLRSNPEDFQSEEEAADSASEVRIGVLVSRKRDWENEDVPQVMIMRFG